MPSVLALPCVPDCRNWRTGPRDESPSQGVADYGKALGGRERSLRLQWAYNHLLSSGAGGRNPHLPVCVCRPRTRTRGDHTKRKLKCAKAFEGSFEKAL